MRIASRIDYADTQKNKQWQGYASASAVAYAKDLGDTGDGDPNGERGDRGGG
jgi:hypothetical protein